ncbi:MAG: putative LacI family transcriptional regulator [Chthonomonadaceae bacterium]|nr:putative LacI family transcriptional regulator [Chthonomonadaceae bacterium]
MPEEYKNKRPASVRAAHPTIATIAAQMGLSRATVTHVLNGRATEQRIKPETQERVLKVAHELGYRANAAARAVRAGRFGNIALIQSLYGQYLPNELLRGLAQAIASRDIRFVLTQAPDRMISDETYLPHTMRELSVDGVIINRHLGFSEPYLAYIHRLSIPAVFLNVKQEFDCVHPDDLTGGRVATELLLQLGHVRIAYLDTDEPENRHYSKHDRRAGYEQAMQDAGKTPQISLLPVVYPPGQPGSDLRIEAARRLLMQTNRPTAILAYEIAEAMAVVHAAHMLGMRIPQDLSIVQFHHRIDLRYFIPIQTVSNAMTDVGTAAVEMLLEKIENPQLPLPARVVPVKMLEGTTCMPLRAWSR